jgi:hypothetical protein
MKTESSLSSGPRDQLVALNNHLALLEMPSILRTVCELVYDLHIKYDLMQGQFSKINENLEIGDCYMTPKEAMNYLGFSKNTFEKYRYKSKVKIKGYQLDGKTWFKKSDLDRFMLTYQVKSCGLA